MEILLNTIMLEPRRWNQPKSVTVPLIDILSDIKKVGFDGLEIWGYHIWNMKKDELFSLSRALRARDMIAPSVGSYLTDQGGSDRQGILNAAKRYFSLCEKLDSKRLRIFYGNKNFEESSQDYLKFIDEVFEEIFNLAKDKGIKVMAEMHAGTVISSPEGLERAIEKWKGLLGLSLVYQPYKFRTDSALEVLDVALEHIGSVHIQNQHNDIHVALSEGDVDYRRILARLASSGYQGPFVLEFTAGVTSSSVDFDYRHILSSAAKDREWLTATWRKINE